MNHIFSIFAILLPFRNMAAFDRKEVRGDFIMSIRMKDLECLEKVLKTDPTVVHVISKDGFTGAQLACKYGALNILECILQVSAANVGSVDAKYGRTCLHWAAANGHSPCVALLTGFYKPQVNMDLIDNAGDTALTLAIKGGRVDVVRLLLAVGASTTVATTSENGKTILDSCGMSEELSQMISAAEAARSSGDTTNVYCTSGTTGALTWELTSATHLSAHSQTRKKCISDGRLTSSAGASNAEKEGISTEPSTKREVVIKLNRNPRELGMELSNRSLLLAAGHSATVDDPTEDSGDNSRTTLRDTYFTRVLLPSTISVTDVGGVWQGIILEKGIIDVHRLLDLMCQKATFSRLTDFVWKLELLLRLCDICLYLEDRNLVWYDLKPANFILFPAAAPVASADAAATVTGSEDTAFTDTTRSTTTAAASTPAYLSSTSQNLWQKNSQWDTESYTVKATDLSSIFPAHTTVHKKDISCTAKFLHPAVASVFDDYILTNIVTNHAHMRWSFAMTMVQILHNENRLPIVDSHIFTPDQDAYKSLTQNKADLQRKIGRYVSYVAGLCGRNMPRSVTPMVQKFLEKSFRLEGDVMLSFGDIKAGLEALLVEAKKD